MVSSFKKVIMFLNMETSVPETKDTETSVASSLARVDSGTKYQNIISNDHVAH